MHRIILPQGTHSVQMKFLNNSGGIVNIRNIDNIKIKSGKKTFVIVRTAL
ncbi:hypothetical protein HZA55_01940 [Candidatus Poribacteria bacterium]|nr:hypothetical protein [Candidatus Poribacteria bacterium]